MENEEDNNIKIYDAPKSYNKLGDRKFWKKLSIQYWWILLICVLIIIGAIIGGIFTLKWYSFTKAKYGNNGNWTFDDFSMKTGITWLIGLFLWECLIVIIPMICLFCILFAITWLMVLSPTEQAECEERSKSKNKSKTKRKGSNGVREGGGFSFAMFLGICIYMGIDGTWDTTFSNLNIGYFVNAWIVVFVWTLIIIGIPAALISLLWYWKKFGEN